tara:strand:- start:147 stop:332 length:186 start_codon:yes stop_codon:yes gene_type:complete
MDTIKAINIIEGIETQATKDEFLGAFQYLIDTGMCWQLQGWYGRTAMQLIENGLCQPSENK